MRRSVLIADLFLAVATFSVFPVPLEKFVFENVTMTLTTRQSRLYIEGVPIKREVVIKGDNSLKKYVDESKFHLEVIVIENQNIPQLKEGSVGDLQEVSDINIVFCGLKEIQAGAFKNLPSLEYLNLTGNLLEEVKGDYFNLIGEPYMFFLCLDHNKISKIEDAAFKTLKVQYIYLNHNQLTVWKSSWFNGSQVLGAIAAGNNQIEEIPEDSLPFLKGSLGRGAILWYLELQHNKLKKIHVDAFKDVKEIGYLNIGNNLLKDLKPEIFNTIKYINNLQIQNNKIKTLDTQLFKNTRLSSVRLENNEIECISTDFYNINEIANINLDGNPITCGCVQTWKEWQIANEKSDIITFGNVTENKCKS